MTSAIIFDLDSCLCEANEVGDHLFAPAFAAIRSANHGAVPEAALQAAFAECWRCAFDAVARKYGFSEAMRAAGWAEFARTEVTEPMRGYADLAVLRELPVRLFLVTSGFRRLQESKIKALGFAAWFSAVRIDAIDEPGRIGKAGIFAELLKEHRLKPAEVLVVGDNPESEITAGNRLGMATVQILRPGVPRGDNANHYIYGLAELKGLLQKSPMGQAASFTT